MKRYSGIVLSMIGIIVLNIPALAQEALPRLSDLPAGWSAIRPGGDTTCSLETPYTFFVRPGNSSNLLIEFQGGGMCWDAGTCGFRAMNSTYEATVDVDEINDYTAGIFDTNNDENPFKDYSMVFVSYCTGDVHLGNNVVTYGEGDDATEFHYNGYVNATAALDWTYENFPNPESVFVTGCSAGAMAAPFYADAIMDHYAGVPVAHLSDAAGSYQGNLTPAIFSLWGTIGILPDSESYADINANNLTFNKLYTLAANNHPANYFSQVNSAEDTTQSFFLRLMLGGSKLKETMFANLAEIAESAANFRSFTAGGTKHCLTTTPDLFSYQVNGVRLRDWVADLAAGRDVESVQCEGDCKQAEMVEPSA